MITHEDLLNTLPGVSVTVISCEAKAHGDNPGCLCGLKGTTQVIDRLYDTPFCGTPTWHLKDSDKRVRLSEVVLAPRS